jgi:hypothetical protein
METAEREFVDIEGGVIGLLRHSSPSLHIMLAFSFGLRFGLRVRVSGR